MSTQDDFEKLKNEACEKYVDYTGLSVTMNDSENGFKAGACWARRYFEEELESWRNDSVASELAKLKEQHRTGCGPLAERADELQVLAESHRELLEYCWDSLCKHDGELRPGTNREWCHQCTEWVHESDKQMIAKIKAALESSEAGK